MARLADCDATQTLFIFISILFDFFNTLLLSFGNFHKFAILTHQLEKDFKTVNRYLGVYQIHITDVGFIGDGVQASDDGLNKVRAEASLVQQVGQHGGERLGAHYAVLFQLVEVQSRNKYKIRIQDDQNLRIQQTTGPGVSLPTEFRLGKWLW